MATQMSKRRKFVANEVFYAELNEVLTRELAEDGYSGVEVCVTPMRTEIIIRATHTQNVLGERGRRIRDLTSVVQKQFYFPENTVELYVEKVNNRGLCAIAQAESLRYKLLGGLAVRRACYDVLSGVSLKVLEDKIAMPPLISSLHACMRLKEEHVHTPLVPQQDIAASTYDHQQESTKHDMIALRVSKMTTFYTPLGELLAMSNLQGNPLQESTRAVIARYPLYLDFVVREGQDTPVDMAQHSDVFQDSRAPTIAIGRS
eukprot:Gb_33325 [translate_table: standard]